MMMMMMKKVLFHLHRSRKKSNKIWLMSNLSVVRWCTFSPVAYPPPLPSPPPCALLCICPQSIFMAWREKQKKIRRRGRGSSTACTASTIHHCWQDVGRSVGRLLVVVGGLGLHSIRSTEEHSRRALALKHNKLIIVINILPLSWHPLERISCQYVAGTVANHPPRYPDYDEQMTARSYWEVVGRPRPSH